jgi:hypothetical protein
MVLCKLLAKEQGLLDQRVIPPKKIQWYINRHTAPYKLSSSTVFCAVNVRNSCFLHPEGGTILVEINKQNQI